MGTKTIILEILLNTQKSFYMMLLSQDMMYPQRCTRQTLAGFELGGNNNVMLGLYSYAACEWYRFHFAPYFI
jgi:hypothetical protein